MRVAVDALGLPAFGGARASALGWLRALGRYDRDNHYLVYVSRLEEALLSFPNIEQRVIPVRNRLAVRVWAQLLLPPLLMRERIDLLHSMKNLGVLGTSCPTIVTVNDLTHLILRHLYPWVDGFYWNIVQPYVLRSAARIIAISESTKRDLMHFYGLEADKIAVIYPSCDERFYRPCAPEKLEQVRAKYALPGSFLLYTGGFGLHKNVRTLIRAFAQVAGEVPHGLVLVGGMHHTTSDRGIEKEVLALGLEDRVWMLGSVPADELPCLYHLADLFLSASLNEGFGLSLLEAMACGTPVLAASSGSVSEVVDGAGLLVNDPTDANAFAAAILELLSDRLTLGEMRKRGFGQARKFSWEKTAQETIALYGEVVRT